MVSEVAIDTNHESQPAVGYEIIIRSTQASQSDRFVDLIRSLYGSSAFGVHAVAANLLSDCRSLERRVVGAEIAAAEAAAAAQATRRHVRLRRLVLAVEEPFDIDADACMGRARSDALKARYGAHWQPGNLLIQSGVTLTYRITPTSFDAESVNR